MKLVASLLFIGFVNGSPLDCPEEDVDLVGSTIGTASNVTMWRTCGEILYHTTSMLLCHYASAAIYVLWSVLSQDTCST